MPKTRKEKETLVKNLVEEFNRLKAAVLTNYQGLSVKEFNELRKELRKEGIHYSVVKINLVRLALKKSNLKDLEIPDFKKPLAIAFSSKDEVMPAKIIVNFAKKYKKPEIISGILEGKLISEEEVKNLATIPSYNELLTKFVYIIKGPVFGLINVLLGNLRGLINVLNGLKKQKEGVK